MKNNTNNPVERNFPHRWILLAGIGCLILRAMIPPGYMPGNLLSGEFMVLCPTGLPAAVVRHLHLGHHGHEKNVVDADRACPIGTALQPALIPGDDVLQTVVVRFTGAFAPFRSDPFREAARRFYHTRAPPTVSQHV